MAPMASHVFSGSCLSGSSPKLNLKCSSHLLPLPFFPICLFSVVARPFLSHSFIHPLFPDDPKCTSLALTFPHVHLATCQRYTDARRNPEQIQNRAHLPCFPPPKKAKPNLFSMPHFSKWHHDPACCLSPKSRIVSFSTFPIQPLSTPVNLPPKLI